MEQVREEMRVLLARYRVKQDDVARRLGVAQSTLSGYLTAANFPAEFPERFRAAVIALVEERRQAERVSLEARLRELERPVELPALEVAA